VARVFLLNPPSPEPVRTPLLSFCHLASSLRAAGHQVALLDASAPAAPRDDAAILDRISAFAPDVVGLHLKTLHVQPAYRTARVLDRWPLCAGGPHATVRPDEPFDHGFRYVVRGEGEHTLVELADALDGKRELAGVAGLSWRDGAGAVHLNAARGFVLDLDALAPPLSALDLFDPAWYGAERVLPPGGVLSSRGCPAACTFCSNDVTGRRFRYRSADKVGAEVRQLREQYGHVAINFFDDSFAVGRRRVSELCAALRDAGPVWWTCTAHPSHLDRETLLEMRSAGCAGVDIGMESADPQMLLRIGKGVTVERVLQVVEICAELGVHVVVNLMFGWPDETDEELDATIAFMQRAAPLAGGFNARGVVVPYPATEIYEREHRRFGFTDWWLREPPLEYVTFPIQWSRDEIKRAYAEDPALGRNFFKHPPSRLKRIAEALALKAELTLSAIERRSAQAAGVPAAGAR
jgi:anaerobic magnesium-protoporphyrin IX monomethyl ester cyclase